MKELTEIVATNVEGVYEFDRTYLMKYLLTQWKCIKQFFINKESIDKIKKYIKESYKNIYNCGGEGSFIVVENPNSSNFPKTIVLKEDEHDDQNPLIIFLASNSYKDIEFFVNENKDLLVSKRSSSEIRINYYHYSRNGSEISFENIDFDLKKLRPIYSELYPDIDVELLCEDYLNSYESLMMLFGEAGIGKTTFIKILIGKLMGKGLSRVSYIKDSELLKDDELWVSLTGRKNDLIVLDDLDFSLCQRVVDKENPFIAQLMSFSDGIFETNTKIVMTTNLKIKEVDQALMRPGRCFDAIYLEPLKYDYAKNIWKKILKQNPKSFEEIFKDKKEIKQADLMSHHERILKNKTERKYLKGSHIKALSSKDNFEIKFQSRVGFNVVEVPNEC